MAMREERPAILADPAAAAAPKPPQPASAALPSRPLVREASSGLSSRPGSRPGSTLQLNSTLPPSKDLMSQLNLEIRPMPAPAPVPPPVHVAAASVRPVVVPPPPPKEFVPRPIEVSIDPTHPSPFSDPDSILDSRGEIIPPKMSGIVPARVPDWLIIMTVYSLVIVR